MISLDSIYENIIAEIIVLILSSICAILLPKLFEKEKSNIKFDPLSVAIFIESIFVINLIINLSFWNNQKLTVLLTLFSIVFGYIIAYIYEHQCPSCKKFIKARKIIEKKTVKEFTKPFKYQQKKVLLYSNGKVWKNIPLGKEETRMENWVTKQIFYECNYCNHKWDSGHIDENLDKKTRPKPIREKTNKKDPNKQSLI